MEGREGSRPVVASADATALDGEDDVLGDVDAVNVGAVLQRVETDTGEPHALGPVEWACKLQTKWSWLASYCSSRPFTRMLSIVTTSGDGLQAADQNR